MSTLMDEEIKRWTVKRKTALVLEIIQVSPPDEYSPSWPFEISPV